MIRLSSRRCLGFLLVVGCGTEPDPPPSLAYIVAGIVSDSLGAPVREVPVAAYLWRQGDTIARGGDWSDGDGAFLVEWQTPVAHQYDSLVIQADGSVSLSTTPCRPYGSVRVSLASDQLQNLPGDSVHVPVELGLARPAPTLAAGLASCAVGHNPFGDIVSDFLLELAIESMPAVSEDSVRGSWRIFFRETRGDLEGSFAGVITNDTLDLALHMAPDNYVECEPGYRLRIALDQAHRLGPGDLETLRPDVTVCPVEQLDPLQFVAFEPPLNAIGAKDR